MPTSRNYVLALLTLFNALMVLDKVVLVVLLEPIKHEFGLSDVQLGVLTGLIYAVFAAIAGIPLGIVADRSSRRNLAASCIAVWSAATAACGLAPNYISLLIARLLLGSAEAGGAPAALSLIADLFKRKARATAMAVYSSGTPLVVLVNLTVMTWLAHEYGWRSALIAASIPGLLLAIVLVTTVREPARGETLDALKNAPTMGQTLAVVKRTPALIHLLLGSLASYIAFASMGAWSFSFLVRSHHVQLHSVGLQMALTMGISGIAGSVGTGVLADRLRASDERWISRLMAFTALATLGAGVLMLTANSWMLTLISLGLYAAFASAWTGPGFALAQSLVEPRMRGKITALLFFLANLIGYGFGPMIVGQVSDSLTPVYGLDGLRLALLGLMPLYVWSALHFFRVGATIRDLQSGVAAPSLAEQPA